VEAFGMMMAIILVVAALGSVAGVYLGRAGATLYLHHQARCREKAAQRRLETYNELMGRVRHLAR
jgi:hypothetical protein